MSFKGVKKVMKLNMKLLQTEEAILFWEKQLSVCLVLLLFYCILTKGKKNYTTLINNLMEPFF